MALKGFKKVLLLGPNGCRQSLASRTAIFSLNFVEFLSLERFQTGAAQLCQHAEKYVSQKRSLQTIVIAILVNYQWKYVRVTSSVV